MQIDLAGRAAIVTGAARGIGREIAEVFASEGVSVFASDIEPIGLATLQSAMDAAGLRVTTIVGDVRSDVDARRIAAAVHDRHGRIDILVNNAGVGPMGPVESLSEEDWRANLDTNLTGTFLMCRAVIPYMKHQRFGRILNASSFAAIIPAAGTSGYAASKWGVVGLTRTLAGELGPWDITVNAYAPGMIPTELNHFAEAAPERQHRLLDTLTLRRWGEKRDVANLLCFLASDLGGYITGTLIDVSGGKLATQIPQAPYEAARQSGEIL